MIIKTISLAILSLLATSVAYALSNSHNELRLETGLSKRKGETAMSYLVSWRKGDSNLHRANGLTFIKGSDSKTPTSASEAARKMTNALNASINYDAPQERGVLAKFTKDKAEVLVSNKPDFELAQITVRDYSNQELHFNIPNKSFKAASVEVAIDFVYSAAVEYIDGFASTGKLKTAGGLITVVIDNNPAIEIKTEGKSTAQIEAELAKAIGSNANFSSTAIYPNFVERKSRNYKAFDGGEVQLVNFNAKSISVDITDSGLGVLTKFKFPDANKPTEVAGKMPYIIGFLVAGVLGYLLYISKVKNKEEELED